MIRCEGGEARSGDGRSTTGGRKGALKLTELAHDEDGGGGEVLKGKHNKKVNEAGRRERKPQGRAQNRGEADGTRTRGKPTTGCGTGKPNRHNIESHLSPSRSVLRGLAA